MQSDRPVQTHTSSPAARPVPAGHPPGEIAVPEEGHEHEEGHIHLPPASVWPITLAGGMTLGGLGLVTTLPISILGLLLGVLALYLWVQELRHELH